MRKAKFDNSLRDVDKNNGLRAKISKTQKV